MSTVSLWRAMTVGLSLLALALGGCGPAAIPNNLADDSERANSFLGDLVAELPDDAKAEYERRARSIEQDLKTELNQAAGAQNVTVNLSDYVDRRLGAINRLKGSIEAVSHSLSGKAGNAAPQQNQALDDFAKNSLKVQLALALRERWLNQHYLELAVDKDKAVAEAFRRWGKLPDPKANRVSDIAQGLAWEPCAFSSAGKAAKGVFSMEGVALGMKRDEAVAALCAAHGANVRMATAPTSAMTHWIAWQDAGFRDTTRLTELPWTAIDPYSPNSEVNSSRQALSHPFEAILDFCFDCTPPQPGQAPGMQAGLDNGLKLRLLPNGQVVGITRSIRFSPDEGNGAVAPKPLGEALAPYQAKFGKPSFQFEVGTSPMIGWVYPNGDKPLPLERWFATFDKSRWVASLHFREVGLVTAPGGRIDPEKFGAQKASASYCLTRHFGLQNVTTGLPGYPYDREREAAEIYLSNSGQQKGGQTPLRYDTRFESPAFLDRCGIVVLANIRRDPRQDGNTLSAEEANAPISASTPVYTMNVTILDTNAIRDNFVREEQEVYARAPERLKAPFAVAPPTRLSGLAREKVIAMVQGSRSAAYGRWMTCLYSRLRNTYEPQDEARCKQLAP